MEFYKQLSFKYHFLCPSGLAANVSLLASQKDHLGAMSLARQISLSLASSPPDWWLYGELVCSLVLAINAQVLGEVSAQLSTAEDLSRAVEVAASLSGSECAKLAANATGAGGNATEEASDLQEQLEVAAKGVEDLRKAIRKFVKEASKKKGGESDRRRRKRSAFSQRDFLTRWRRQRRRRAADSADGILDLILGFTEQFFSQDQVKKTPRKTLNFYGNNHLFCSGWSS